MKSCPAMHAWLMRYSVRSSSSNDAVAASSSWRSVIRRLVGDFRPSSARMPSAQSERSASRDAKTPARSRWAKQRVMASPASKTEPGAGSPRCGASAASTSSPAMALMAPTAAVTEDAASSPCVPMPMSRQSPARRRLPVRAIHAPNPSGSRLRTCPVPTSGNSPIPVSGIANIVRSVTTRCDACTDRPTPPPIVIPSMNATTGFG